MATTSDKGRSRSNADEVATTNWSSETYDFWASTGFLWLSQAESQFYAAELLFRRQGVNLNLMMRDPKGNAATAAKPSLAESAMVMMGFALENAIKGVLACDVSNPISSGGRLAREVKTHDLLVLYERAKLPATEAEKNLLDLCGSLAKGHGRYPIGLHSGEFHIEYSYQPQKLWQTFVDLFFKVSSEMFARGQGEKWGGKCLLPDVGLVEVSAMEGLRYRLLGEIPARYV